MASSVTDEEKGKNAADEESGEITIKVSGQDGKTLFFKIKKGAKLKKLMTTYCDRHSMEFRSTVFLLNGRQIGPGQTPEQLQVKDGDEIDAMLHQQGGGGGGGGGGGV